MNLLSEKVYARDLMSSGATDCGARGCRARGPTLGAAMAMLTALGPAWPRSAGRKNGRDGRRLRVRSGGLARFPTMSKAARAIQWVRARYIFTLAARTRFIASTAQTSQDGSDMPSRQAASG